MSNSTPLGAAAFQPRALHDLDSAPQSRSASPEASHAAEHADSVWDALALVMHQQVAQDALLLWRPDRDGEQLQLLSASPTVPMAVLPDVAAAPLLRELACGELEAVAHVHCAYSDCPLERKLWTMGMHAGVSAVLGDPEDPLLVTVGFRERWQLVAHHTPGVVALASYLRECFRVALGSPAARAWWQLSSRVPHLWRQPWRPSIIRTVHDVTEVLIEAADHDTACAPRAADDPATTVARVAHSAGELTARLENLYWDSRPSITAEELLAEALLLVRGAYQLCRGHWPGCLAATGPIPQPPGSSPAAIRHELIDWVLSRLMDHGDAAPA
jgi:hypothetical protein